MAFGRFFEGIRERIVGPEGPLPPQIERDVPQITRAPIDTIRRGATTFFTQLEQNNLNAEDQQAAQLAQTILQNANPADALRAAYTPGAPGTPQETLYNQYQALRNVATRIPEFRTRLQENIVLNFVGHDLADPLKLPDTEKLRQLFDPTHAAFGSVPASMRRLIGDPGDPGDPTAVPPRPPRLATPGTHPELSRSLRNAFEIQQALGNVNPAADLRRRQTRGRLNIPAAELTELINTVRRTDEFLQNEMGWDFTNVGIQPPTPAGPGGRPPARPRGRPIPGVSINNPSNPEEAARVRTAGSTAAFQRFKYHEAVHAWRHARRQRDQGALSPADAQFQMDRAHILANDSWNAFETALHDVKSNVLIDTLHRKMRAYGLSEEQILQANDPRQFGMLIASDVNRLYANIENLRRLEHLPTPGEEFEIRERSVWKAMMERWQRVPAPVRFLAGVGASTAAFFGLSAGLAALFPTIGVFGAGAAMVAKYGVGGAVAVRAGRGMIAAGFGGIAQMVTSNIFNPRKIEQKYDTELRNLLQTNQEALLRDPAARRDLMRQLDENRLKMRRELSDKMKSRGRWALLATLLFAPAATMGTCALLDGAFNNWNFTTNPNVPTSATSGGTGAGVHAPPTGGGAGTHTPGTPNTPGSVYGPPVPDAPKPGIGSIDPRDLARDPSKFIGAAEKSYTIRPGDYFEKVLKGGHNVFGLSAADQKFAWDHSFIKSGFDGKIHPMGGMSLTHPGDHVHLLKLADGYHYVVTPDSGMPLGDTPGYHDKVVGHHHQPPHWMEQEVHGHDVNHFPHHGGSHGAAGHHDAIPNPYDSGADTHSGDTPPAPPPKGNVSTGGGEPFGPPAQPPGPPAPPLTPDHVVPGFGAPEHLPIKTEITPLKGMTVEQYIAAAGSKDGFSALSTDPAAQAQATEIMKHIANHKALAGTLAEHLGHEIGSKDTVEKALNTLKIELK